MTQRASGSKKPMVVLTTMISMPLLRAPREGKLQYLLLQLEECTCTYAQQVCTVAANIAAAFSCFLSLFGQLLCCWNMLHDDA